ncbi:MAG: FkbM family methyltransferase [Deltaproteobacteria bacterium]|nr:FkbM family methyltransferase [Deltaproteobacteria bacterium]
MIRNVTKKCLRKLLMPFFRYGNFAERIAREAMLTPLALHRIAARGLSVESVLDVGASNGCWSLEAKKIWPKARYHLIEANSYHENELEQTMCRHSNFSYVLAAAGDSAGGTIHFDISDPFGGIASHNSHNGSNWIEVPITTIDIEVRKKQLPKPYLIKLDTHGFEVPIINGAKETLIDTNLLVIEAYNFDIAPECLKFYEMCSFMDRLGFRVIDISEPLWRIKDKAFWQMDMFFVQKNRLEFSYAHYR